MGLIVATPDGAPEAIGTRRRVTGILTFSSSYATNGDTLVAKELGLDFIDRLFVQAAGGRVFEPDLPNSKVKAFQSSGAASAMAEVPNATDLSSVVAAFEAVGL